MAKPTVPTPEITEVVRTRRIELVTEDGTVGAVLEVEDNRDISDNDKIPPFTLVASAPDSGGVVFIAQLFQP